MILATRESMERLVAQIGEGLASNADATITFPKLLANCEAVGFDSTETAYALSFHLDTEPPFRRIPWQRAFGSAWALGFTLIGVVAIVILIGEHLR